MRRQFVHVYRLEDIWIDLRIEADIRKMDYCLLSIKQIIDFNLADIPPGVKNDGNILDCDYTRNHVEDSLVLSRSWLGKESVSVWNRFQSILANTNIWLKRRGLKSIKIRAGKDFDHGGPVGKRSEIKGRTKDGASSSAVDPIIPVISTLPKLTIKGGKDTGRVLKVKSTELENEMHDSPKVSSPDVPPLADNSATTTNPDFAPASDESPDSPLGTAADEFTMQ